MKQMTPQTPTRPIWEAQGEEKRLEVRRMFSAIAPTYDRANALMSFSLHQRWRRFAAAKLGINPGDTVLDLCTGTGDFLPVHRSLTGNGGVLLGIDFCAPMLAKAVTKDSNATLSLGDACSIPLGHNAVDAVSVGWGIRNVPDIDLAHREINRVLKPGKRFVSIDCAEPRSRLIRIATGLLRTPMLGFLGKLIGSQDAYQYLSESTARFKSREELAASMRSAGFIDVHYKDLMLGNICVHWGTKP
jgi:demethylmenaquinone methyltransferase/2-methoxy-6-polyprenyl-1,4-benzoquinol methylase